jgi:ACS family tartrate transporter-like MFS transporter
MIVLALVIMNVGISATKTPLWAMARNFLSGAGAAAGVATIDPVGNPGGFSSRLCQESVVIAVGAQERNR